jgi:hypothetical protein
MKAGFRLIGRLLVHPVRSMGEEAFAAQPFGLWFWCQAPMLIVLTVTGLMDPAPGRKADAANAALYLGGAALVCGFSMLLNFARNFLALWAGGQRLSPAEATRRVLPLSGLYALLEAAYTAALFALRPLVPATPYAVLEQICLFGLQLFFAAYLALVLYHREGASSARSAAVGLGCFLASSAWLLLGTIFG